MCFNVISHQRIKVATTNIKCWKVLNRGRKAHFHEYYYEKGMVNPVVKLKKKDGSIYCGYHSYQTEDEAKNSMSYASRITFVKKFIIPVGTKYYQNDFTMEYVSETIILTQL